MCRHCLDANLHLGKVYAVFFSSYKLPKTVTVTTLLLFGHVTLLRGTLLFILLIEGPVKLSNCQTDAHPAPRCQLIKSHWFGLPILHL